MPISDTSRGGVREPESDSDEGLEDVDFWSLRWGGVFPTFEF